MGPLIVRLTQLCDPKSARPPIIVMALVVATCYFTVKELNKRVDVINCSYTVAFREDVQVGNFFPGIFLVMRGALLIVAAAALCTPFLRMSLRLSIERGPHSAFVHAIASVCFVYLCILATFFASIRSLNCAF